MNTYLLSRWQAVELFAKIVAIIEQKDKEEIKKDLRRVLIKYGNAEISKQFAIELLQSIANDRGSQNYYPKFLYDLSKEIKENLPIIRTEAKLTLLLNCVDEANQLSRYELLGVPNKKEEAFENSFWWLYSYERYKLGNSTDNNLAIGRFPVELLPFGHATIATIDFRNNDYNKKLNYIGSYLVKDGKHLILNARTENTKERELRLIFDIDMEELTVGEVALGYYLNASSKIYFGPIILQRAPQSKDGFKPAIFTNFDEKIDVRIWKYFDGLQTVPNELPMRIRTLNELDTFIH
ncbi:hypothetical protein [Arcicella lustrica]|uniref:Uncharacterized protein n=1 Tax=Arcicella lustrica TaxID=2984196 RepID=A0ABU5SGH8_9BACT|nr:hypothetical protein [Arcicella sp. DC25W]MEA5426393.1 hypothetical protein [Arcicella sp. DC25W]